MNSLKKKCIPFISTLIFILSFSFIVKANVNPIVDDANLLSQSEKNELIEDIENFREKYNMDAVIVTSNDLEGKTPRDYADDYYDYNGYIMEYKQVKEDILKNGLIYTFNISLEISE